MLSGALRAGLGVLAAALLAGCQTPPLEKARSDFHAGQMEQAEQHLEHIPAEDKDTVLYLMERGMIRHVLRKYDNSSEDWQRAAEREEYLQTYSISRGAASMISNDRALPYRGTPFEMTLLYSFLAKNYLAESNWDYAAICARNIIKLLEDRDGFPDIPYSRYMAGFCLEMINDAGNAAIQYTAANENLTDFVLDSQTGRIMDDTNSVPAPYKGPELVVFVAMDRIPSGSFWGDDEDIMPIESAPYAEIYADEVLLGRARSFDSTAGLLAATRQRMAAMQLAKDISRIAVKETIATSLEYQNEGLGQLVRLMLFAMEAPDTRRWETLPRWLAVARLPCPPDLESYTVVFHSPGGSVTGKKTVTIPITRRGNIFISFCRDL